MTRLPTHVLFDFFGTLVEYEASRTTQGYEQSFALLREAGTALDYQGFLSLWSEVSSGFEAEAEKSHREFSMEELTIAFLRRAVGRTPEALVLEFVRTYLSEWNKGVHYPDGVKAFLERLSGTFTLAVITNTHDPRLVPDHLENMGVSHLFSLVATSVGHGRRKPAPEIFHHAMHELGAAPDRCLYVGDSYEADYRGAVSAGIPALLIDPLEEAPIPEHARLATVFALEQRLLLARLFVRRLAPGAFG